MHYAPEIAASNVVEIKTAARPTVLNTNQPSGSSHDRRGAGPINLIGFIYPSNPPRSRMDHLTVIALSFIVANCALGIAIADKVLR